MIEYYANLIEILDQSNRCLTPPLRRHNIAAFQTPQSHSSQQPSLQISFSDLLYSLLLPVRTFSV